MTGPAFTLYFWGFLLLYGTVMYVISPPTRTVFAFFAGTGNAGKPATQWAMVVSA